MEMLFVVLMFLLSISLILLVLFQPRQQQSLSTDATSNLGKPNYWLARRGMKLATLIVSVLFFLVLLIYLLLARAYKWREMRRRPFLLK